MPKNPKHTKPVRYCDKIELKPFYELNDWRLKPPSTQMLAALGDDYYKSTLADQKIITANKYWILKGISPQTVRNWRKKDPDFDEKCKQVLFLLGDRREELAAWDILNANFVKYTMPLYDAESPKRPKGIIEMEEWKAKLADQKQIDNSTKIIVMEKFPTPEEVAAAVTKSTRSEFKTTHEK
jgi:hypothetical protein